MRGWVCVQDGQTQTLTQTQTQTPPHGVLLYSTWKLMATQGGLQWDNDNDMTINIILFSRNTDNRYTMRLQSALVYIIVMFLSYMYGDYN